MTEVSWPASRAARPKQFLPLARGKVLIAATVERMVGLCPPENVWIVTNRKLELPGLERLSDPQ